MKKSKFIVFFLCQIFIFFTLSGCNTQSIDYQSIINDITLNKMKANVSISVVDKGLLAETVVGEGSGVIFDVKTVDAQSDQGSVEYEYLVLSNNHVVALETNYTKKFVVKDYVGVKYEAELVAKSKSCDLSLLKFKTTQVLEKIEFATELPREEDVVFVVGTPQSQPNAITVGKYVGLVDAPKTEDLNSKISFKVIKHTAQIKQGSSGSMLLDKNLRLIGINYAGLTNAETKEYVSSLAVPFTNINEFLQMV